MKMLRIAGFLLISSFACAVSSAEINKELQAGEFAKKVSSSTNWDHLISNALHALPKNRIDEFQNFSKTIPFPKIVLKKSHFEISDENGARTELRLYKNGASSINQTKFQIHPLATIEDEIHRISETTDRESRSTDIWNPFEATAVAGILSPSVALATHVVSTGWAADECGKGHLSDDQKSTCPLMAVSMRVPASQDNSEMLAVSLTCPKNTSNGTLEMIDQNQRGMRRTRVTYVDGNPVSIELAAAPAQGSFFVMNSFKIGSEKNKTESELADSIPIQANSLKSSVCDGSPQDKKRYYASLSSNAASLRKAQSQDQNDSDNGGTGRAI